MKPAFFCLCLALSCQLARTAAAQDNTQAVTPPAPVSSAPLGPLTGGGGTPSGSPGTPVPRPAPLVVPPSATLPASPPDTAAGQAPTYAPAPATPQDWVARGTADLQALDKVNARNATLSIKVGQTATFGSLTIAVQACVVTAPDQPQDAAAYLVITDKHEGEPGFSGWMLANAPSVSMLQNPIYDVRVAGCRA